MSVNPVPSAVSAYVQKVSSGSSSQGGQSAAVQEASETPQVTAQEAARGDRQAMRKLASQQHAPAPSPVPAQGASEGGHVNHLA
jgi:hypothetical protein